MRRGRRTGALGRRLRCASCMSCRRVCCCTTAPLTAMPSNPGYLIGTPYVATQLALLNIQPFGGPCNPVYLVMCSTEVALPPGRQGFGDFLTELPAGPPARRRLAQGQGQGQGQGQSEGQDSQLKSTQFNVAAFQRQPDRVVRCTAAATCYPEVAREAAAVVAIFSVDLELGVSGLCTGAPHAPT